MTKEHKYISRTETGLAIYNAIQNSGYTQVYIATAMKISPCSVSRWATGRHIPDLDSLAELADVLGVPLDTLIVRRKKRK